MRAFTLDSFEAQPSLRDEVPEPRLADDEVLVRVRASSVNAVDVYIAAGGLKEIAEHEFPVTIDRDFAGVVEKIGSGVSRYRVADEVFGFVSAANPDVHEGSWADLIAVPEDNFVAAMPSRVDFTHAGAAPVAALTAIAAFDALSPAKGENVLVLGAAGGSAASSSNSPPRQARTRSLPDSPRTRSTCADREYGSRSTAKRVSGPRY